MAKAELRSENSYFTAKNRQGYGASELLLLLVLRWKRT
jgi:hypothetical protein